MTVQPKLNYEIFKEPYSLSHLSGVNILSPLMLLFKKKSGCEPNFKLVLFVHTEISSKEKSQKKDNYYKINFLVSSRDLQWKLNERRSHSFVRGKMIVRLSPFRQMHLILAIYGSSVGGDQFGWRRTG